jgi:hypothetical protein
MNRSTLRAAIVFLTLATAAIHFYLVPAAGIMFVLNGLGYLALMVALVWPPAFLRTWLAGRTRWVQFVFIAYTAVTILLWVAIGDKRFETFLGQIGWADKIIEALLIVALALDLRQEKA